MTSIYIYANIIQTCTMLLSFYMFSFDRRAIQTLPQNRLCSLVDKLNIMCVCVCLFKNKCVEHLIDTHTNSWKVFLFWLMQILLSREMAIALNFNQHIYTRTHTNTQTHISTNVQFINVHVCVRKNNFTG
jgi:hypothetical protein